MKGLVQYVVPVLVATIVCLPVHIAAQGVSKPVQVEIHYMPPGEKVWLSSANAWGRGFGLEDYKLLLKMDNDLYLERQQTRLLADLELSWTNLLEQKDKIIETLLDDKAILVTRSMRLEQKWEESEEARAAEAGGPLWPYVLAIAGSVVGIAGIIWGVVAQATAK